MNRLSPLIPLFFVAILFSCNDDIKEENAFLQHRLDSINNELKYATGAINALIEVGAILDSIEEQRNIINIEMRETNAEDTDFAGRVERLNTMLVAAEDLVGELEEQNSQYLRVIRQLKKDLEEKTKEVQFLELVIETMREENISMKEALRVQDDKMYALETTITERQEELRLLEEEIQAMQEAAEYSKAESLYKRAEVYEEVANRTKLAAKKKKEALQDALTLYKEAYELGLDKAQQKVTELEEKLK